MAGNSSQCGVDRGIFVGNRLHKGAGRGLAWLEKCEKEFAQKRAGMGRGLPKIYAAEKTCFEKMPPIGTDMSKNPACGTLMNEEMSECFEDLRLPKQSVPVCEQYSPQEFPEALEATAAMVLPVDIMMKLAEDVLSRLRTTQDSLASTQLALELGFDERSINSVLHLLLSQKKIFHKNLSNTWSISNINDGSGAEEMSNIARRVLNQVSLAERHITTMRIACALGYRSDKEITPILYELKKQGYIEKVQESPPSWKYLRGFNNLAEDIEMSDHSLNNMIIIAGNNSSNLTVNENQMGCEKIVPNVNTPVPVVPKSDISNAAAQYIKNFALMQKNPMSALHELSQKYKFDSKLDITEQKGSPNLPQFHAVAVANGEIIGESWAATKKESKRNAAEIAIRTLVNRDMKVNKPQINSLEDQPMLDPDSSVWELSQEPYKLKAFPEVEDVLSRLDSASGFLTAAQLALELGFEEGSINSVLHTLLSQKKVKTLNSTWASLNRHAKKDLTEMEERVLKWVSLAEETVTTMEIAHAIGCKSASQVNPVLYGLRNKGCLVKFQESPPSWKYLAGLNNLEDDTDISDHSLNNVLSISRNNSTVNQKPIVSEKIVQDTAIQSVKTIVPLLKNPISKFHEYGQKHRVESKVDITEQRGSQHTPQFHAVATVNGEVLGEAWASTKKDSRKIAADLALQTITNRYMEKLLLRTPGKS